MTFVEIAIVVAIIAMFCVFGATLAWGYFQTNDL